MNGKISFFHDNQPFCAFILLLGLSWTTNKMPFFLILCNCQSLSHFNAAPSRLGALRQVRVASTLHFLKLSTALILSDSLYTLVGHTVGKEELGELSQAILVASPLPVSLSKWPSSCIYWDESYNRASSKLGQIHILSHPTFPYAPGATLSQAHRTHCPVNALWPVQFPGGEYLPQMNVAPLLLTALAMPTLVVVGHIHCV